VSHQSSTSETSRASLSAKKRRGCELSAEDAQEAKRQRAEEDQERAAQRQAAAELKLRKKWEANGYTSHSLGDRAMDAAADQEPPLIHPAGSTSITYLVGDATKPERPAEPGPAIILHCVDTSGSWCSGRGMFGALEVHLTRFASILTPF
jgi:hypothetical protein